MTTPAHQGLSSRSPRRAARAALLALAALTPAAAAGETRAIWVTRYDYRTADDVRAMVRRCADAGANRLLLQVRGNASVFYPSDHEPWSHRLGGADPGFDPLALAVREAQARGLAVEAWINVLPLWKGEAPPADPDHPYLRHPEWVVVGDDGAPQRRSDHYVCANPARPDVRAHVAAIAAEVAGRYAVDAVHLDYIRYVLDLEQGRDFSHDAFSLAAFGGDPAEDPEGWRRFKVAQITETVRAIRTAVRTARADCRLTAAVFPTRESRAKVHQDVEAWVHEGLVDALYPMTYAQEGAEFARRLDESLPLGAAGDQPIPVVPGVAVFRHDDPAETRRQVAAVRAAGAAGFALFCYASLFPSADAGPLGASDPELRARRAESVRRLLRGEER